MNAPAKTKEYIRPIPSTWWMHNRHLMMFMIREVTAVFVAGYAIILLVLLNKSNDTREVFRTFYENVLLCPGSVILQMVILAFVLYHSATTFQAAPVLMVVRKGEEKVDPRLIIAGNVAAWVIISLVIWILVV